MIPKIDLYTKTVLTVIALALVAIAVRPLYEAPPVSAQQKLDGLRVVLAGYDLSTLGRGIPVNIMGAGDSPSVPVSVNAINLDANAPLPVSLVGVAGETLKRGPLPVAVQNPQVQSK